MKPSETVKPTFHTKSTTTSHILVARSGETNKSEDSFLPGHLSLCWQAQLTAAIIRLIIQLPSVHIMVFSDTVKHVFSVGHNVLTDGVSNQ